MHYAPEKACFVWKIKQLAGGKDYLMRAHFGLPSVKTGTSPLPSPQSLSSSKVGGRKLKPAVFTCVRAQQRRHPCESP